MMKVKVVTSELGSFVYKHSYPLLTGYFFDIYTTDFQGEKTMVLLIVVYNTQSPVWNYSEVKKCACYAHQNTVEILSHVHRKCITQVCFKGGPLDF